jgi:hypothetical protein
MSTEAHEHILISRVIDGDASEQDWQTLEGLALREPHIWRDLAEAQRDHAALMRGVASALALADVTPLPSHRDVFDRSGSASAFQQRLHRLSAWAGWAVAAVIVLAFTPVGRHFRATNTTGPDLATIGPNFSTPDEALANYMTVGAKSGRVLGEVPTRVMVRSNPAAAGEGYEVIYLRQIIEKTNVRDLYEFSGQDERGEPTLVKWKMNARGSM